MIRSPTINPATGRPLREVQPDRRIMALRRHIIDSLIKRVSPQSKYDAAQSTSQNELHWAMADHLSPDSANSLAVRKTLRSRSRYETANNGFLKGITLSLAGDFVGSGPTLQITDKRFNEKQKESIERQWAIRAKKIKLRRKLWQLRHAKCESGEGFAFAQTNRRLKHMVKADQKVVECDQVTHYDWNILPTRTTTEVDGIRFDGSTGEPTQYHLLNDHPGESILRSVQHPTEGKWISADRVIHWFRRDRGGLRGIPETTPTLPLWALLRRYTLAVVQNAEIAADFTVLLKSMQMPYQSAFPLSGSPGEPTEEDPDDWFASFPVDRGLMTVLPALYDLQQLDPKQPVTMYDTFVAALVQEAARPMLIPRNMALGCSGEYNMASGTLDRQMYSQAIRNERLNAETDVLDVDLEQWWWEASRVSGYFEGGVLSQIYKYPSLQEEPPEHCYRWDKIQEHVDPLKVAMATDALFKAGHISDTDIQEGEFNRSVEEHYANLEKQKEWRDKNWDPVGQGLELSGGGNEPSSDPSSDQDSEE